MCTNRLDYVTRFVSELNVGTVNVWEVPGYRLELTPFGGIKDSGLGYKEGVVEAMKSFTNVKTYSHTLVMQTLLNVLSGIALLVWGTHIVRTGVLRVFGGSLRRVLASSVTNPFAAFLAGLGVTGLVQSSSATALITSSFVAQKPDRRSRRRSPSCSAPTSARA